MGLNSEKRWECPKCSKTFKKKKSLNRHVGTHDPKVKCQVCGKVSKNPVALATHMRRIHANRERPKCDVCHREFFDSSILRQHMDAMHGSGERHRFPCRFPACEKTYLNQNHLLQHVKADHSENPVRFSCTLCGKEFKRRLHLERHILTHTTEKPFNCATCWRSFARMETLKGHEVTHLENSVREILQCDLCPLTFLSRDGLQGHIRGFHENRRNFCCTVCNKRFLTSGNLKRHVEAAHPASKEKIHSCDKCEYRSHSKYNLARHERRHGAKKHECYFCGKKFVAFRDLVRHCGRIHTLEKKF